MKKLLLALTFSVVFSSPASAGWTEVVRTESGMENLDGTTYYMDVEGIQKHDGFSYFWYVADFWKMSPGGDLSFKANYQVNCATFRWRMLAYSWHVEPMGRGSDERGRAEAGPWQSPSTGSAGETMVKRVCDR